MAFASILFQPVMRLATAAAKSGHDFGQPLASLFATTAARPPLDVGLARNKKLIELLGGPAASAVAWLFGVKTGSVALVSAETIERSSPVRPGASLREAPGITFLYPSLI